MNEITPIISHLEANTKIFVKNRVTILLSH